MMLKACIPMPVQVVIDDVGWRNGYDGHEKGEPFRTGIPRSHVPEDYQAIADLGRNLGIRPLAAMILCEWDKCNILRRVPSSTWMGADWDNSELIGVWMDEAADIIRKNRNCFELSLHGIGHEYWEDGVMSRAEWHDEEGNMRPYDEVMKHLDYYAEIMEQHSLGPFPRSFVPCAFLHRYGAGRDGIVPHLEKMGVKHVCSQFSAMKFSSEKPVGLFGFDGGVLALDRWSVCPWNETSVLPDGDLNGPVCGLHWPNVLHDEPGRNNEAVDAWTGYLKKQGNRFDMILACDIVGYAEQLVHYENSSVDVKGNVLSIDASRYFRYPVTGKAGKFTTICLKVSSDMPVKVNDDDVRLTESQANGDEFISVLEIEIPRNGFYKKEIIFR